MPDAAVAARERFLVARTRHKARTSPAGTRRHDAARLKVRVSKTPIRRPGVDSACGVKKLGSRLADRGWWSIGCADASR